MKKFITGFSVLIILFVFTSCTKVIYTHNQVMGRYQNKSQVVAGFGLPTEKRSGEGIEEWLYNYGTVSTRTGFGNSNTNASVYGNDNSAYGNANTTSLNVTQFTPYARFVKFTFDAQGNVLKWQSQGVDNSERKKNTTGTILLIVGGAAFVVLNIRYYNYP